MEFIYSFLFAGIVCLIGQIILDNTKLLPGHITSLFVVIGAALDTFSIYDLFVDKFGAGAIVCITSFGHLLIWTFRFIYRNVFFNRNRYNCYYNICIYIYYDI